MRLDPAPEGKVATIIEHEGRRVGAIVHDADLAEEPKLVQAVGAAAALTSKRAPGRRAARPRRRAPRSGRGSSPRDTRNAGGSNGTSTTEPAAADGARINLRLARDRIGGDPQEAAALLDASLAELNEATRELRELARGIHPAALTDRGLEAALGGLAGRSPVPVKLVETPHERLPSPVESAVYFVVAEALTNVARYAQALTGGGRTTAGRR